MTQTWKWTHHTTAGETITPVGDHPTAFDSQSDAETWLGEVYPDLLEQGVDEVRLYDGDQEIYGPMSLHPAS